MKAFVFHHVFCHKKMVELRRASHQERSNWDVQRHGAPGGGGGQIQKSEFGELTNVSWRCMQIRARMHAWDERAGYTHRVGEGERARIYNARTAPTCLSLGRAAA